MHSCASSLRKQPCGAWPFPSMLALCRFEDKDGSLLPLSLDMHVSQSIYTKVGRTVPHGLLIAFEHSGNGLIWIPGALLVMLLPRLNWQLRMFVVNLLLGFVLDLVFVGLIKVLVRRSRPSYHSVGGEYNHLVEADKFSFPSGHASRSVFIALMMVIFRSMCRPLAVVLACVWAVCTSMSRVLLGRHYVTDVVAGAAVGVGVAALVSQVRTPAWKEVSAAQEMAANTLSEFYHSLRRSAGRCSAVQASNARAAGFWACDRHACAPGPPPLLPPQRAAATCCVTIGRLRVQGRFDSTALSIGRNALSAVWKEA